MQRGTSNSDLPIENYISRESIGLSNSIPIIVTPFQGTYVSYVQGLEQRISQPISLSLPARVSLNHENGADSLSSALTSSNSRSIGSIRSQNASYTVVSHGRRQELGSTSESLDLPESMSATNTMLPNEATSDIDHVPSMYPMINHTPRFAGVNRGPARMPLHPFNFHMAQNAMPQPFHVDVENVSYEGLLAFQDQVGFVNTGLSREVISARMKCIKYQSTERSTSEDDTCCICLDDFSDGQIIGCTDCQHTFHFDCISQWLMQKNSCSLCRTALVV